MRAAAFASAVRSSSRAARVVPAKSVSKRFQHSKSNFSSYEYPLRNEAPVVTRTTAADAAKKESVENVTPTKTPPPNEENDPFDDAQTISHLERLARLKSQRQFLSTTLEHEQPILTTPPASVPPNVDFHQLEVPQTLLTTLPNGLRVVSQETYGQVSTVGILGGVGSRLERASKQQTGIMHLSELLAFRSTSTYDSAQIQQALQDWGGVSFANAGREQFLMCIDVLRPNVGKAMELLKEVLLEPKLLPEEVEDCKRAIEFQTMDVMPEVLLSEALQRAAYGPDQQLGQPHFCPLESLPHLTAESVRDFWASHVWNNPEALVVAGAGIEHDELVDMARHHFGQLQQQEQSAAVVPSAYRGGFHAVPHVSPMDNYTRMAIGLEVGGWHSDDLVTTCVLQTLLGGGNSFSAGGPGKGMYSRLYRQVLNRYAWAESCEAFTAFHNETGLWGISGSAEAHRVPDLGRVLCNHFSLLATAPVEHEELDRARNMLKCNVLTQLESRLVLFEDIGRQVLTYGHRESVEEMCGKIEAVSREDLQRLAQKSLEKPPTVAAVGPQPSLQYVPLQEQVQEWLQ